MKALNLILILFYFIGNQNLCAGQGRDNLWMFGYSTQPINGKADINFITGQPVITISGRQMNTNIAHANITDNNGNLLFYTNGAWIANAMGDTMVNGSGLSPGSFTPSWQYYGFPVPQAVLIIPDPGDSMKYYLFHSTVDIIPGNIQTPLHLYYSVIDMNLQGGSGEVILKNQVLLSDTLAAGNLQACKHANGRDWWLIAAEFGQPGYYTFLITPSGIQLVNKQVIGQRLASDGQSMFNRQGTKYARYDGTNGIDVFNFDRCTGILSNNVRDSAQSNGIGVGFSPDGTKVYKSHLDTLTQYDLNAGNFLSSKTIVATWDSTYSPFSTYFFVQQLAPDNKLYIASYSTNNVMHYVEFPDSAGIACHVVQHGVQLPVLNSGTVPNHPNYHLGPVVGSICDSLSVGIKDNNLQSAELRLNPNPCHDNVWVNYHFPNNKDGWLEIYNSIGKLVVKRRMYWSSTQLLLYTSELRSGIYFVKLYDDSKFFISSSKLIKN